LGAFFSVRQFYSLPAAGLLGMNHTSQKINQRSLTYLALIYLIKKTQRLIIKEGGYVSSDCQIKIETDGKVAFFNMPDWWQSGFGDSHM
jgi:hypothetical protein